MAFKHPGFGEALGAPGPASVPGTGLEGGSTILGGAPTWQQANGGTQQGMGYGLPPAGGLAGLLRSGRGLRGNAKAFNAMREAPMLSAADQDYATGRLADARARMAPPSSSAPPGLWSDPAPSGAQGGGGLQGLLSAARGRMAGLRSAGQARMGLG